MRGTMVLWLLLLVGCDSLVPAVNLPRSSPKPQEVTVKVQVVDGKLVVTGGKLSVGNGTINVASESATECPCCGLTGRCRGLCGKAGCLCSRSQTSHSSDAVKPVALPQRTIQPRIVYQCRNGVCAWYPEDVQFPVSQVAKRSETNVTNWGNIRVLYEFSTSTIEQMKRDLPGVTFERVRGDAIPVINGYRWTPTVMKTDGASWTPGPSGWTPQSYEALQAWMSQ